MSFELYIFVILSQYSSMYAAALAATLGSCCVSSVRFWRLMRCRRYGLFTLVLDYLYTGCFCVLNVNTLGVYEHV